MRDISRGARKWCMPAGLALEEDATSRSSRVAHRASGCSTWTLRKVARRRPSRNSSRRTAPCLPPSRRSPAAADGISSFKHPGERIPNGLNRFGPGIERKEAQPPVQSRPFPLPRARIPERRRGCPTRRNRGENDAGAGRAGKFLGERCVPTEIRTVPSPLTTTPRRRTPKPKSRGNPRPRTVKNDSTDLDGLRLELPLSGER